MGKLTGCLLSPLDQRHPQQIRTVELFLESRARVALRALLLTRGRGTLLPIDAPPALRASRSFAAQSSRTRVGSPQWRRPPTAWWPAQYPRRGMPELRQAFIGFLSLDLRDLRLGEIGVLEIAHNN